MQDYLATRGYQKEQFEELIALLIRQDNKVSRIWFETEGKRTICTDSGIRESEAGPSKKGKKWRVVCRRFHLLLDVIRAAGRWHWGSISLWIILHAYFSNLLPAGKNYAYILNDSGVIVAHPEEKWLGMRLLDSLERRRVKQVVGENKRIHVTGFSQFYLCLSIRFIIRSRWGQRNVRSSLTWCNWIIRKLWPISIGMLCG